MNWIDLNYKQPKQDQYCKLLLEDDSEAYGIYFEGLHTFSVSVDELTKMEKSGTGYFGNSFVTHWMPLESISSNVVTLAARRK